MNKRTQIYIFVTEKQTWRTCLVFRYKSTCESKNTFNQNKLYNLFWVQISSDKKIETKTNGLEHEGGTFTIRRLTLLTKAREGSMLPKSSWVSGSKLTWIVVPLETISGISEADLVLVMVFTKLLNPFCKGSSILFCCFFLIYLFSFFYEGREVWMKVATVICMNEIQFRGAFKGTWDFEVSIFSFINWNFWVIRHLYFLLYKLMIASLLIKQGKELIIYQMDVGWLSRY